MFSSDCDEPMTETSGLPAKGDTVVPSPPTSPIPENGFSEDHPQTPQSERPPNYRIPRKRYSSSPLDDFRSPLNRSKSRSPNPSSSDYKRRRVACRDRSYSPRFQRDKRFDKRNSGSMYSSRYRKHQDTRRRDNVRDRYKNPTKTVSRNLNPFEAAANTSLIKMKIPACMQRKNNTEFFDETILPHSEECNILSPRFLDLVLKPEKFSDPGVSRMVDRGYTNQDFFNKTIHLSKLNGRYAALSIFTHKSINWDTWSLMRKETIANSGLIVMTAFADEQITWAKTCLDNGVNPEDFKNDLLLNSADLLCQNYMFKIKQIISCLIDDNYQQSIIRQICYLICSTNRLEDACFLMKELTIDFELGIITVYILLIPMLIETKSKHSELVNFAYS